MNPNEITIGANMAFRTAVLKTNRFDTELGPLHNLKMLGEDEELGDRLKQLGLRGVWVGNARVRHYIPPERLNAAYIWEWHACLGRYYLRRHGLSNLGPKLFGAPRWLYRQYVQEWVKASLLSPFKGSCWFAAFKQSAVLRGMISELRGRSSGERQVVGDMAGNRHDSQCTPKVP